MHWGLFPTVIGVGLSDLALRIALGQAGHDGEIVYQPELWGRQRRAAPRPTADDNGFRYRSTYPTADSQRNKLQRIGPVEIERCCAVKDDAEKLLKITLNKLGLAAPSLTGRDQK